MSKREVCFDDYQKKKVMTTELVLMEHLPLPKRTYFSIGKMNDKIVENVLNI